MYRDQFEFVGRTAGTMRELSERTRQRAAERDREAMVAAFAMGIDSVRAASDVVAQYRFDSAALAEVCVEWILRRG